MNEILVTRIPLQLCYNFLVSELLLTIILQAKISDMRMIVLLLKSFKVDQSAKAPLLRALVTEVMDTVFEEILRSMERNDFKESQRRIGLMKFIAEAFNYKLIHSDTLFDLLYKLINYDFKNRRHDAYLASLDHSNNDSFRIRLVCSLLDGLGAYFNKGERRAMMDRFLLFF